MTAGFGAGAGFGGTGHLGDTLSALLDGELPAAQQEVAQAHVAACPACAEELAAVRQARSWVRALPPVDPPFGFYERMLLDRARPVVPVGARTATRRRAGLAALGAAAAAATVLGIGSPSPRPVSPSVPRLVEAHATGASVGADLLSKLAPVGVPMTFGR